MIGPDVTALGGDIYRPLLISPSTMVVSGLPSGAPLIFTGERWPGSQGNDWGLVPSSEFRDSDWDLDKISIAVLGEVVQQTLGASPGKTWAQLLDTTVDAYDPAMTTAELAELRSLIEYRAGVFDEAMAQRAGMLTYMRGVLNFRASSHPSTYRLCVLGFQFAQFQNMYWKRVFKRPRPSRLDPTLVPPIEVPGHAAYPSGHACEAMMVALLLEQILPSEIIPPGGAELGPLRVMARRIARNREVLGLHYPSDTRCGFKIAARSLPLFLSAPTVRGVEDLDSSGTAKNAAGDERSQAAVTLDTSSPSETIETTGHQIYLNGLLAKARLEWA
ncbi:phosphatase PAP2 family protein [Muricoccus nepalensis]|uniref:phosphatase PAP2 family protein n=1 Tax=Muricoccus nepalensis TaxID=1854500 RepID=UPI0013868DE8|nr:phosphatase PAP2 family protein [Roseomonas nepalensis]